MVKNKALPESARLCTPDLVTLSFSLSPSQTWPCQGWSHASSLSLFLSLSLTDAIHPEGIPWILPRLDPGTVAHQVSLAMEFSKQEYWNSLPSPTPGDLPNPGMETESPALQVDPLLPEQSGKPIPQRIVRIKWDHMCDSALQFVQMWTVQYSSLWLRVLKVFMM